MAMTKPPETMSSNPLQDSSSQRERQPRNNPTRAGKPRATIHLSVSYEYAQGEEQLQAIRVLAEMLAITKARHVVSRAPDQDRKAA